MKHEQYGPITLIRGENGGRHPFCHSLFIREAGVLVDPSSDRTELKRLRDEGAVRMVWLSHWHEDHLMHLDLFDDLPLWMSEEDAPPLTDPEIYMDWYRVESPSARDYWREILKKQFHFRPRRPVRFLRDGERIDLGVVTVEILKTPGHSPGHLALYFREPNILFLGDYDLAPIGPWYGEVYATIEDTFQSIRRLKDIPAERWLCCHGKGVFDRIPDGRWQQYEAAIHDREKRYLAFLDRPRTISEIAEAWIFYGKPMEPAQFYEFGERLHAEKHLQWLLQKGLITEQDGSYSRQ